MFDYWRDMSGGAVDLTGSAEDQGSVSDVPRYAQRRESMARPAARRDT